ncbi:MAG TPA: NAD(P)/FAD-dependent oxidoreductase, partial [Bacillota bacterium]
MPPRIVVAGGGFAGLRAAQALAGHAARGACDLILISDQPNFLYRPGMSGLAVGRLSPKDITRPLAGTRVARLARLVIAPVTGIDPDRHVV